MPGVLARPSWLFLAAACVGCSGGMSDGDPQQRSISDSERRAIEAELGDWGATGEIGPITRLSVDSFSVDFDGITHYVSLREDGILTEGSMSSDEIEVIKRLALNRRKMPDRDISSIEQMEDGSVEVTTGDFGTASGELIVLKRHGTVWQVESVGSWVE